jgi:hypothetical protein
LEPRSQNIRLVEPYTFYRVREVVGKSCDQVGRTSAGEIAFSDSGIYDKWAQALSSADDLTYLACSDGERRVESVALSAVFPLVVVPNGRLWITEYDSGGRRIVEPQQVDCCSYFVKREYSHPSGGGGDRMTISHLEFVTCDGLLQFVESRCGDDEAINRTFPLDHCLKQLSEADA